jgi:dihydropteroate synthase
MFKKIDKPMIMGILNATPDSFSDGGQFTGVGAATRQAITMIDEGADIIDIGGESTQPGSNPVDVDEQIRRVVPVIEAIRENISVDIPISIDTTQSKVARAALEAGANIINDVSAGCNDEAILTLAAERNTTIILMHMQGKPKTMQDQPYYQEVIDEVLVFLEQRIQAALKAGIQKSNIVIDPGIGFGKRKQDNFDLLAGIERFVATGFPVLLGTSRKGFLGKICDVSDPTELVTATAVTTALAVMNGVQMFRVHDVMENRQAADIAWTIRQSQLQIE